MKGLKRLLSLCMAITMLSNYPATLLVMAEEGEDEPVEINEEPVEVSVPDPVVEEPAPTPEPEPELNDARCSVNF